MLHRAFEVFISSNGRALDEYEVKIDEIDPQTITCFIPSEPNKSFSICYKSYFREAAASVRCVIDGRKMGASFCSPGKNGHRWGVRSSPELRQPFQFSELTLTEDDNTMLNHTIMENLGCIDVIIHRVQRVGRDNCNFKSTEVIDIGSINEKSKKAGTHCVSLGEARQCVPHRRKDSVPFISGEGSFIKFRFRYRPRAILQAQGLITSRGPQHRERQLNPSAPHSVHKAVRKRRMSAVASAVDVDAKSRVGNQPEQSQSSQTSGSSHSFERSAKRVKRENEPERSRLGQDVIDLTLDTKRERSPIRLAHVYVGQVIDLTLEDD